jgi:hypothetical protein
MKANNRTSMMAMGKVSNNGKKQSTGETKHRKQNTGETKKEIKPNGKENDSISSP